jgi:polyisoprenoid-binding protein YceI
MRLRARTLLSLAAVPALFAAATAAAPAHVRTADAPSTAVPIRWQIDPTHSDLTFRIRHTVSQVPGRFNRWSGTITADPANLSGGSVAVEIQAGSIDTGNERRDAHLRTADFFDAENHPTLTFRSTRVVSNGSDLAVHGDLTIRGVTRPIVLQGRINEPAGAAGSRRIGFQAETTIDRTDFGVAYNTPFAGGGMTLGDDVTISIAVAAVEQPAS